MQIPFEPIFLSTEPGVLEVEQKARVDEVLHQKYGNTPDKLIAKRIEEEWIAIKHAELIYDIAALCELVTWLKKNRVAYWMCGAAGSSLTVYFLGITRGNPLPAHYLCPKCKMVLWKPYCKDGFDLPTNIVCSTNSTPLVPDGHDIPWQSFFL